jgi:hypothetical protein
MLFMAQDIGENTIGDFIKDLKNCKKINLYLQNERTK